MPEVTSVQAAQIIGVIDDTVRNYVDRGLLPARRQGLRRKIFIELSELEHFAAEYDFRFDQATAEQITRQ
ncbi:helix-turn-helix domain-containing protein [Caldilinea sp.]|uniref:helix-turn-helix domain-containing protein n=1 Tax=Caldilinea sp. TaxID=2293560 RepID=UPI002CDB3618|nr:helix-turn-helix domain-containing protein [Caldilinea sp.]